MRRPVLFKTAAMLIAAVILFASFTIDPGKPRAKNTTNAPHAVIDTSRLSWWNKARFGMFIHWGVYSVLGGIYEGVEEKSLGEWIMQHQKIPVEKYKAYAKQFNPVDYDPEKWVLAAQNAGMKYIVITTKHHDGFAMFDSKASDWNIVKATPYGKDVIKMLADACRKHGMKLGFYYSQANDWNNPGGAAKGGHWDKLQDGSMDDYIDKVAVPQIREILTNYGDVAELWWDVPTDMTKERADKFLPILKQHPNLITNDRLGGGVPGDLVTPEQYIPATGIPGRTWEACMTMNDTWGFKINDHKWKSSKTLIRNLVDIASKGGNYLLNVGPEPSGKFPEPILNILNDMGKWMKVNSESIYATTPGPFKQISWGRCTAKELPGGNTALYLHVFEWPTNGELLVPALNNDIVSANLLAGGASLTAAKTANGITIKVPATAVDENSTVIKLVVKGPAVAGQFVQTAAADGSYLLTAVLADTPLGKGGVPVKMSVEGRNEPSLGTWIDPSSSIVWQFNAKPGTYTISTVTSSSTDAANSLSVNVAGQSLQSDVPGTGNKATFKTTNLGEVKIDKAGVTRISLAGSGTNWNSNFNVQKVIITPKQ